MAGDPPADPQALLRSPEYARLVVLAAVIGVPITALAYGFLKLVAVLQDAVFNDIPNGLGLRSVPDWWLAAGLALAGVLVAAAIEFLPGTGGHSPADGFKAGPPPPAELPGVVLASLATLALGVVLGPEAPLIIIGSGLGVIAIRLAARDAPGPSGGGRRRRGQLRGHQHAPRVAARRCVPADGGVRDRRADARASSSARAAGGGDRGAHLPRARLADRLRHLLAGGPRLPTLIT